ncbi:MAG TPA: NUDIX domain-containing protein [Solirubrobacteraceae bacterium]|jgi:predicted NUDIX family NTP pyrophosphohydrolase
MASRSAGLLPYRRRDGRLEVLIGHMGGPYWAKKDERAWSIVKGELLEDEQPYAAALREFAEETGVAPPAGVPLELGQVRQSSGKTVAAWAIEAEQLDAAALRSNTFELEWPPRSGRMQRFEEMDRFEWCPLELACRRLIAGQVSLAQRLAELLASGHDG